MFRNPSVAAHYEEPPQQEGKGWRRWITRGANFAIVYTEGTPGASLADRFVDEHFAYALEGGVRTSAGGDRAALEEECLAILPPGDCEIHFERAATLVQVITAQESLTGLAPNTATYADGAKEVAPAEPWPEPVGGYRLRTYATREGYARGGMVHAYRTRKLMIVPYERFLVPRDDTQLTPHSHADFEQASVALEGQWLHHLRVPWTANRHHWKPDRTVEIGSPSVTIIPAGVIHTSQGIAGEGMRLIDVFSPPRIDFSQKGWVDNAAEYPMPSAAQAGA
jgi:mannose-6-phosphate isomerase-like protein (cupin superfamily)